MSEDGDFKPFRGSTAGKAKKRPSSSSRKPGRGAVSCASCRARKVSCDLIFPACSACKARGEELSCSFQNLLNFDDPSEIPSVQLKAKLDLLESKILKLRSTSQSSESPRPAHSPKQPLRAVSAPSSLAGASPRPSPPVRFVNQDAEVASRLLVSSLSIGQHHSSTIDFPALVSQLVEADARLAAEPVAHLAEPTSLLARPTPEDLQRLMQLMPTHRQATAAISSFFQRVNPLLHVLHRPSFEAQCEAFWKNGATNDGRWLATYLGVCGNGLMAMSEAEAAASSMPVGDGKGLLVRSWIDGALQALCSGGFAKNPSLEALRAVVLLNMFWASWDGGKHLEAAVTFNMTAISTVWELELPRDPDELSARFTPLEAEERRRVFWALFSLDTLARSFLGKPYHPLDAATISCRLPSELPDEAYSPTTGEFDFSFAGSSAPSSMKPVIALHSVCLLLCKISKATTGSGSRRPSSIELLALHEELEALDTQSSADMYSRNSSASSSRASTGSFVDSFPSLLKSFAQVKLARGNAGAEQAPGEQGGEWWRDTCTKHATLLLSAIDLAPSRPPVASMYTSLACWSSAITLAIDMLGSNFALPIDDIRARLSSLRSTSQTTTWPTSLRRVFLRGTAILQQLAEQEERKRPSGLTAPAGSFFGLGHTNSPSSSTSGFDHGSMVDTPFFLPQSSSINYLRAEQYLSPLPYAESFSDNYYQSSNLDDYAPTAPSHSNSGSFDSYNKREDRQLAPLLKPWLSSTATLVSPLTEFNMASWSRATALDSYA